MLLNLAPDHLDRHGTFAAYAAAKLEAFARQDAADVAVLPADLDSQLARTAETSADGEAQATAPQVPARRGASSSAGTPRRRCSSSTAGCGGARRPCWRCRDAPARAPQRRERDGRRGGLSRPRVWTPRRCAMACAVLRGVAHRLEEVAEIDGVLYVNDSKATNVASTLVALEAFAGRPLHLILGGQGKGQDFSSLREPVRSSCAAVYLIGEHASTIAAALQNIEPPVSECGELRRAVSAAATALAAMALARAPACSLGRSCCSRRPARASTSSPTSRLAARLSASSSERCRISAQARRSQPGCQQPQHGAGSSGRAAFRDGKRARRQSAARRAQPLEQRILLTATLCLLAFGAVMVYSASSATSLLQGSGNGSGYLVKYVDLRRDRARADARARARRRRESAGDHRAAAGRPRSCSCSPCTSRTSASASTARGAGSGAGPLQFQPSELMKLALVLYGATLLAKRPQRVHDLRELPDRCCSSSAGRSCSSSPSRTSARRW